jgi:hypothetical protein
MSVTLPSAPSITVTAHANTDAVEYIVPPSTNRITVYIDANPGDVALDGTDATPISADAWPVPAAVPFTFRLHKGRARQTTPSVFIAADAADTVRVFCEVD